MRLLTKQLNVSQLIEPLTNKTVLNPYQRETLEEGKKAGRPNYWLASTLYSMIEHKSSEQQLRFFQVVREKRPCLITEQDITELAESVWN